MTREQIRQVWRLARTPFYALVALTVCLGATITIAYVHLGPFNLVVALTIAAIKVAIIGLIFMELRHESAIHRLAAGIGIFWLSFLFLLSGADYLSR